MRKKFAGAIDEHRLRAEIVATKLANRIVNRLGVLHPLELAAEEGASTPDIAAMFVAAARLFDLPALWAEIETADMPERARIAMFDEVEVAVRSQLACLLRICPPGSLPQPIVDRIKPDIEQLGDRKSVVEVKSVSVRVDFGGRRFLKK